MLLFPGLLLPFGNWIEYHKESQGVIYYFKDVKRNKEKITFYNMIDNERPNDKGVYCTIDKREANCNNFSLRYLEFNFFYGPLCIGTPDSVPTDMIKKFSWKNNTPESIDFKIIQRLCNKF